LAAILFLPALYIISISWIHLQNARHKNLYDELKAAAQTNGLLVHHPNRPQDPPGFNRFYDESKPYRSSNGLTSHFVGYKNDTGEIVLPAIYRGGDWHFYEGFNYASDGNGRFGYILPDGSWAFKLESGSGRSFFNGRARIMRELHSPLITPQWREGFIDKEGNVTVPMIYTQVRDYIGELDSEYTLVGSRSWLASIDDKLMNGIDINIPPIHILFPATMLIIIDKDGNPVPLSEVRSSIKRLEESANAHLP